MPRRSKPSHWAIVHRASGEHHFAIGTGGTAPAGYDPEAYEVRKLSRAPGEHDAYDGERLTTCKVTKAERLRAADLNGMTNAQLYDRILADVARLIGPAA